MAMPRRQHYITNWDDVPVVMDIAMAARVLGMTTCTLKTRCRRGDIAATKVGGVWRITKEALMRTVGLEPQ